MEFNKKTLGEICEIVTDYVANGSFKSLAENVNYQNSGVARVVRLVDFNNKWSLNDSIWVDEHGYEFLKKSKLYGGEIILTNVGANLGTVFIVPNLPYKMTLGPNAVMLKSKEEDLYLYYWLISSEGKNKVKSIVTGSAMPKFNKTDLKNIEIRIPDIYNQRKIVKVLKVIDKKIELNNQINDNLQKFGLEMITQEMKKDATNNLRNIIRFIKGKKPLNISKNKKENYLPYLTIANLNNQENLYASIEKVLIAEKDLLMVMDGASSGDIYYSDYGIVGSTLAKIEILDDSYNQASIYFIIKYFSEYIKSKNTGSAIPHTDKEIVYKLIVPDIYNQKTYENILNTILENNKQNKKLEQLRDTLLPKLMNGEIDLDKIEI